MRNSLLVRQMLAPGMPPITAAIQSDSQLLLTWRNRDQQIEVEVRRDGSAHWHYVDRARGEEWEKDQDMDEPVVALAYTQLMAIFQRAVA